MQKLKLTDLIDVEVLQRVQDGFSKFTGMASLTTDENGIPVTEGSAFTDFCINHVRKSELGVKCCEECDKMGAKEAAKKGCAATYFCHAGLVDYSAPIMVEGQVIGNFLGGQVRIGEVDEEKFRARAIELGVNPDEYVAAAKKTPILEKDVIERTAEFLSEIAKVLSEMAYQNYLALQKSKRMERAARSQATYIMNMTASLEEDMKEWQPLAAQGIASNDTETMKKALVNLQEISEEALSDVRDVLEYIHLSAGEAMLSETEYDIKDIVQQIKDSVKDECEEYGVDVKVVLAEDMPQQFMGDSGRIVMLFAKVLQMIIKHVKGTVTLEISSRKNSYSTWLVFAMKEFSLDLPKEMLMYEIQKANKAMMEIDDENKESETTVEQLLVRQLNGTVNIHSEELANMNLEICLPQLAVRGQENGI